LPHKQENLAQNPCFYATNNIPTSLSSLAGFKPTYTGRACFCEPEIFCFLLQFFVVAIAFSVYSLCKDLARSETLHGSSEYGSEINDANKIRTY